MSRPRPAITSGIKHVALYLAFLLVPFSLVLLAFQLSRNIEAPTSIAGRWLVQADSGIDDALACRRSRGRQQTKLHVTQSGPRIAMRFYRSKVRLEGAVRDGAFAAHASRGAVDVRLRGRIDRGVPARGLSGVLEVACPEPVAVAFRGRPVDRS